MCAVVAYNNAVCVNNQSPLKPDNFVLGTFSLIFKTCSDLLLIPVWQSIPNELAIKNMPLADIGKIVAYQGHLQP